MLRELFSPLMPSIPQTRRDTGRWPWHFTLAIFAAGCGLTYGLLMDYIS